MRNVTKVKAENASKEKRHTQKFTQNGRAHSDLTHVDFQTGP